MTPDLILTPVLIGARTTTPISESWSGPRYREFDLPRSSCNCYTFTRSARSVQPRPFLIKVLLHQWLIKFGTELGYVTGMRRILLSSLAIAADATSGVGAGDRREPAGDVPLRCRSRHGERDGPRRKRATCEGPDRARISK